jgi:hypothetical protein
MDILLRKVARELRYRPLPGLIGTTVTIASAETAPETVTLALAKPFSHPIRFRGPQEPWMTRSLAKYRLLDLTFAVDGLRWEPSDCPGISTLKEFGFALHPDNLPEDQREYLKNDKDPTCLGELAGDIDQGQVLLRLFLEESPRRDALEHVKELMRAGKGHLFFGGVNDLRAALADFFPHQMAVSDACLTNAESIWFHKHFYL